MLRALPEVFGLHRSGPESERRRLAEYSPDGQWVAWLNASDGSLWRSRVDGSERIELTTPPLRIFTMKWSPDDRRLALMAEEPGKPWKIYLIDAEGGKPTPVLNEDRNEADPDWSPDGQSIVFGRLPDRMDSGQPKAIYLLNLADPQSRPKFPARPGSSARGSRPTAVTSPPCRLDQKAPAALRPGHTSTGPRSPPMASAIPTWSHDGRFLYFQDFLETGKPIYRIAVPSGKPEQLATIDNLRPIAATDYRLIGLAPGDLPIVSARTSTVNLYSVDLNEQ